MSNAHLVYTDAMYNKYGYMATWVPNVRINLGDVGTIHEREFTILTNLSNLGINFDIGKESTGADYEFISSDNVTYKPKLAGQAPVAGSMIAKADAGVSYFFHNENAIVFQALDCRETSILDQHSLGQQILNLYEQGKWPGDYVVVTNLITSKSGTVLISSGNGAVIELRATVGLTPGGVIKIADVNAGLQVVQESKIGTKVIASKKLTPLFTVFGVKKNLLLKPKFVSRGDAKPDMSKTLSDKQVPSMKFVKMEYGDFD